jgi:hypothetical protein
VNDSCISFLKNGYHEKFTVDLVLKELGELEVQKDEDIPSMDKLHYLEVINLGLQIGEHTHHEALWFYCLFLLSPSVPSATPHPNTVTSKKKKSLHSQSLECSCHSQHHPFLIHNHFKPEENALLIS